jgi:hypothetical protein
MGRRGHTTPAEIAKAERLCAIMSHRLEGRTFRQIGMMLGVSPATAHRHFWRVVKANPPSRRRQLARLRQLAASDDNEHLVA